ncbi:AAA family ATPase [Streptococcus infantarius]|uniref:AAA family ATPase n=1 Tax=Streptococcus infantarius TaxID=102684 RepID=UPI0022E60E5B|nr:AAA family ATPase [Streptococcus infantarius]
MTKVSIYYYSRKEFTLKIPKKYTSLSELAREDDLERQEMQHYHHVDGQPREQPDSVLQKKRKKYIKDLVIDSDEYAGVQEHAIMNFANFLDKYDIQNIYIQNPPVKILEQMTKLFGKNIKIHHQEYASITDEIIKRFYTNFSTNIIGQENAKDSLSTALIPLLLNEREKPVVILLYGNSGIGKTESVKLLANTMNEPLFREQFSMYQNNEFSNYMFGGKHSEKSFAKDLLDRNSNIILLDEFDKASPTFYSAFYQLFDEGIFVDKNYSLELKKSVIICTSNFQSIEEIKKTLGDAIFGRFDNVIHFEDLNDSEKNQIGMKIFDELHKKYTDKFNYTLKDNISEKLKEQFVKCQNVRQIKNTIEECLSFFYLKNIVK